MKDILNYLNKDSLWNIGLTELLKRGEGKIIRSEKDGVILSDSRGVIYLISADSLTAAEKLTENLEKPLLFLAFQDFLVPYLKNKYTYIGANQCVQAVYTKKEPLKTDKRFSFKKLDISYLAKIAENYHYDNEEGIEEKLNEGRIYGIFNEEEWMGFVGMHDEGSMGMLHVFPAYRGKGAGTALASFMVNRNLEMGYVPFAHIISDNQASISLNRKLNMNISEKHLFWLF